MQVFGQPKESRGRESRSRAGTWKVSMATCAMSAWTRIGLKPWGTRGGRSPSRKRSTTKSGRTVRWASRRHQRPCGSGAGHIDAPGPRVVRCILK